MTDTIDSNHERSWQEVAERCQKLLATPGLIPWELTLTTWRFTYVGPQAVDILGYPVTAWLAEDFWRQHIHPEDRDEAVDFCMSRTRAGVNHDFEYRMVAADGRAVWLRDLVSVVKDRNGRPTRLRGVMIDVTAEKEAQRASRISEQRFRDFAEASSDWFWETDENHVYTWVSDSSTAATGLTPEWFLGKRRVDLADTSMDPEAWVEHKRRLEAHEPYRNLKLRISWPGGQRWVRSNGVPVFDDAGRFRGYRGTGSDTTAQVEAEEETQRALALFHSAIESIADGFALFDADDRFVTCNERYRGLVADAANVVRPGVPFETLVRRAIEVGEIPDALGDHEAWLQRRMLQHRNPQGPFEVRRKNSWLRIHENRMADGGTVIVLTDITREKQREEQLRHTQKMEAIGKLTGGLAHDFNNLLSVIAGNIELLLEGLTGHPDLQAKAATAIRASERGATLTRSLLAFARQQPLQPTAINLNRLVDDTTELIRRTIPASIAVRVLAGHALSCCTADVGQLQNVLLNLAVNARDAMADGGTLTIETASTQIDEDYAAQRGDVAAGDYVTLTVSDTGAGMTPDVLARAFEPFYTTKPVGRGTGLGLSMVYGFAKQSGGHVTIYSELGVGTTVRLYLPCVGQPSNGSERAPRAVEPAPGGEQIVVVEDDPDMLALVAQQLGSLGYRVVQASDGATGLEAIEGHPDVALLLSDVVLAGETRGPELAERALALRPGLRVVLMSGYPENAVLPARLQQAGTTLLNKPFTRAQLSTVIRGALAVEPLTA